MLLKQAGLLHRGPEFCHALKFVIKLQISTLLQQLAESGEESVVLTANVVEGTADHLGSLRGAGFLEDQEQLQKQFLTYCTETRRLSIDEDGDQMPVTSTFGEPALLSPSQTCSPAALYHRGAQVRPHYERESSMSDSVFSPNRRKSSASSKSLDEEMSLMSSQDYSDTPRSFSESSGTWPELSAIASVDLSDKGTKYVTPATPTRSPTIRQPGINNDGGRSEPMERMKHVSKSPMTESVESIKHINLSSPTETQYKRVLQASSSNSPFFAPSPVTSALQLSTPPRVIHCLSSSGQLNSIPFHTSKSNIIDTSGRSSADTPTNRDQEKDGSNDSPVNLASSSPKVGFNMAPVVSFNTGADSSGMDSPFQAYKGPFFSYGDIDNKQNSDVSQGAMFKLKFEGEEVDKYKSGYDMTTRQTDSSYASGDSDTLYRVHKKAETKIYHRHGSSGRKQPKSCIERRASDTVMAHSQEGVAHLSMSPYSHLKEERTLSPEPGGMKTAGDVSSHFQDIASSYEEAVKIQQQSLFHSSLGLLSPMQRQFLPPTGRPLMTRERSQSLSEFHTVTSPDILSSGRSRFPSSSFAENLDTPLVIDDEIKVESESVEGLDLSNKKRKMSVDDVHHMTQEEAADCGAGGGSANQGEESGEFERQTGGPRLSDDQSTKKYGKGNFIKVATGYQCRICCRVIRHMNNTTAHMRIHANVKPYKCQVCNQQFKYEVDRRYHFSKNHVDLFSKMYFPEEKNNG